LHHFLHFVIICKSAASLTFLQGSKSAPPKLRPAGHIRPAKVFYVARVAVIDNSIDYFVSRHHETITTFKIKVLSALTNVLSLCEYDLSTLQTQFYGEIQLILLFVFK
jgi:hypothetical protein